MNSSIKHIDKTKYIKSLSFANVYDLIHYSLTGFWTFYYRYLKRIAGRDTIIGRNTKIINPSRISIGRNCLIQDHVYMRAGFYGRIVVGNYCAINSFVKLFGHGGIEIGDYSQLGPGALITTTSHDYNESLKAEFKKVNIGKFVWIGANSTILPGIDIGDKCIIGAGSLVNKSIPANHMAAGNPVRIIKKL